jgi:hypothetical protein
MTFVAIFVLALAADQALNESVKAIGRWLEKLEISDRFSPRP